MPAVLIHKATLAMTGKQTELIQETESAAAGLLPHSREGTGTSAPGSGGKDGQAS